MEGNAVALWDQFVQSGIMSERVKPFIRRSWERCRDYGVNFESVYDTEFLSSPELAAKLEERRTLVKVAAPVMENLYLVLKGLGFMVVLADPEGYIIKAIIDDGFKAQSRMLMLCEGANWSEKSKGTNAIGTSLVEQEPLKVLGHEHFVRNNHVLACAAVPILGTEGQVLGTLDVTGDSRKANERVFRMVSMSARTIEQELKMLYLHKKLDIYKAKYQGLFELIQDGAVIVDEYGTIREISPSAGRVLGVKPEDCLGGNIEELFNLNNMWVLDSSSKNTKEITISPKNDSTLISAKAKRIYGPDGTPEGMVAIVGNNIAREPAEKKTLLTEGGNAVRFTFDQIIGESKYLQQVISICKRVAKNNSTVLLTGETGTGKEILAQAIHQESSRSNGPFIAVNCAAIPAELIESELFGYEDGAFTGARKGGNPGKFELADGGTIFLDEIGDMSARAQVSLLRVLQEKQFYRVGGHVVKPIDVRVIAATHRNLADMVRDNSFRKDLFFRLNIVNVYIPPLRSRDKDILLLTKFFLNKYKDAIGRPNLDISEETLKLFKQYSWPGNIRELENMIEGLVNVVEDNLITVKHLPPQMFESNAALTGDILTLKELEKAAIQQAVRDCSGCISAASAKLDIGRSTLYRKIKEYQIEI